VGLQYLTGDQGASGDLDFYIPLNHCAAGQPGGIGKLDISQDKFFIVVRGRNFTGK